MSPTLPPTPPTAKVKRNVFLFAVLVIACTLVLAFMILSALFGAANQTTTQSAGRSAFLTSDTVGTAAGIAANDTGLVMERAAYAQKGMGGATPTMVVAPAAAPAPMDANAGTETKPRIIRNGNLSLRVQDAPGALEQAKSLAEAKGGFVESSSISDPGNGPQTGYATIRIPVTVFDAAMTDMKKLAVVVLDESTNANDVTMQYVDLESNLRNARAEEQSYLELLKRTGSMNDVLSVTRALADVRGRIEQLDGQKRYMENQTDDATIQVTLTEETRITVPTRTWKPLEVIRQAFSELVRALQGLVDVLIRLAIGFVGLFIPIAAIVALFVWLGWKVVAWLIKRIFTTRVR